MDKVFRFSDYDILAYIASGIGVMLFWDLLFDTHWIVRAQWSVPEGVTLVVAFYVIGHVVAWPAAWLAERRFVARVLGPPSQALFEESPHKLGIKHWLFPDYFTPLNREIRERVKQRAGVAALQDASKQDLFWRAFAVVKRDPSTYSRMEAFLKLYGFCRNVAFVSLVGACALAVEAIRLLWLGSNSAALSRLYWSSGALVIGVAMLYRYLRFHRLYSVEVFVGYAELPLPKEGSSDAH